MPDRFKLLVAKEYLDDSDDSDQEELTASNALAHVFVGIMFMLFSSIAFYVLLHVKLPSFSIFGLLFPVLLVTIIAFFVIGVITLFQGLFEIGILSLLFLFSRKR